MTPRPPYRWKSFWLGLLVLCFLIWAWRYSFGRLSNATRYQKEVFYQMVHIDGELVLRRGTQTRYLSGETGWSSHTTSSTLSATRLKENFDRFGDLWISIPDTSIIGFSAFCFSTFIIWRSRRWKRHAADLAADLSEQP